MEALKLRVKETFLIEAKPLGLDLDRKFMEQYDGLLTSLYTELFRRPLVRVKVGDIQ